MGQEHGKLELKDRLICRTLRNITGALAVELPIIILCDKYIG